MTQATASELAGETCPQCGVALAAEAAFCHKCGVRAGSASPALTYEQVPAEAEGYEYVSPMTLLGVPLIHVVRNKRDPVTGRLKVARGFIASGERAVGVVAVGSAAAGVVAIGGAAVGVVAWGGVAVGLFAGGGVAAGLAASFGGLAGSAGFAYGGVAAGSVPYGGLTYDLTWLTGLG